MILKGRAWTFGDNISTDQIIPGRFFHLRSNLEELAKHVFADIAPGFHEKAHEGDIIVGGQNFGLGSSREHAAIVIKRAGIGAVVAKSFGRIFYRNAVNVGLAVIICDASGVEAGDELELRVDSGLLVDHTKGFEKSFAPLPSIMQEILNQGGLVNYIKRQGGFR